METKESESRVNQLEKALVECEARFCGITSITSDAIIMVDKDQRVIFFNKGAEEIFGFPVSEIAGQPLDILIPHQLSEKHKSHMRSFHAGAATSRFMNERAAVIVGRRKDGSEFPVEASISKWDKNGEVVYTAILRDVTEQKKIQEELLKTMKLESIGHLAGGIAHDFNNILAAIMGNISLIKMDLDPGNVNFKRLRQTEKAALRASDLALQLLTFSKGNAPQKRLRSIVEPLKDSVQFVLRGSNVRPEFYFDQNLWAVEFDEGQLKRVIDNVVINAQQAMPQGGVVLIRAENREVKKEDPSQKLLTVRPGNYVLLSFQDSGKGIPKEHLTKIFDPFFTTKEKGSGLGLFSAYSIIKNHGGGITVSSEEGTGTNFSIFLPAFPNVQPEEIKTEEELFRGSGRILVLDDDVMLRKTVGDMLQYLGYQVEYAGDGEKAITLYKKAKEANRPFHAAILDLTLPGGIGGHETFQRMIKYDPTIKAIVSSGYSENPIISNFKKFGFKERLAKPYQIQELSRVLHQVLSFS